MIWQTSRFRIDLTRPQVMGIVNVTPDSFSDGGRFAQADAARAHCDRLVAQGADILDIGGESTRPGARLPDTAEQLARVLPVLRHAVTLGVPVSVDTADPVVMRRGAGHWASTSSTTCARCRRPARWPWRPRTRRRASA